MYSLILLHSRSMCNMTVNDCVLGSPYQVILAASLWLALLLASFMATDSCRCFCGQNWWPTSTEPANANANVTE